MTYELVVTEPFGHRDRVYQKGDVIGQGEIADVAERDHPNKTVRRQVAVGQAAPESQPSEPSHEGT